MEDNCKSVLLQDLIEKRRLLSKLRGKIIETREKSENNVSGNDNCVEGEQEDPNILFIKNTFQDVRTNKIKIKEIHDASGESFDYDSDDSVKDKNYEPNKDDYNSSCSQISNSPDAVCINRVKRRLFSPNKNKLETRNCPLPMKRPHTTEPPEINFEIVPLKDKLDVCLSDEGDNFSLPPAKKLCLERVIVDVNLNGCLSSDSDSEKNSYSPIKPQNPESLPNNTSINNNVMCNNTLPIEFTAEVSLNHDSDITTHGDNIEDKDAPTLSSNLISNNYINVEGTNNTSEDNSESLVTHKVKKKIVNTSKWKRNASKIARLKGSPYRSAVAKKIPDVEGRKLKDPCSCKAQCYLKISNDQRLQIFNEFWKKCQSWDQRRQFIVSNVKKSKKRLMKTDGDLETDRRKFSYTYSLTIGGLSEKVCKVMYLNTLSIGEKFVKISIEKQLAGGLTIGDQRGKHVPGNKSPELMIQNVMDHIKCYPFYESHYSRQKSEKKYLGPDLNIATMYAHYKILMKEENTPQKLIAKECIYRNIFNTKFNLSFKLPSLDTCDDCDEYQNNLKNAKDETEKKEIEEKYEDHSKLAEKRYMLKKEDKEEAMTSSGKKKVLMFDLQKCLATPNLTNTKSFYLRKLWTLNLTIFDATDNSATNMLWSENVGGRGGNEIASCLLRWADENKLKLSTVEELTFWSDNCAGQNRNFMIVSTYIWLLHQFPNLKVVNHKFMLKGHTHMEVDQVHSQIERKKKQLKTMQIAIPRDWSQFIRTCGGKRNFDVFDMTLSHFKDITSLYKKNGPLVQRKKNKEGIDFKISECVYLKLKQEAPGVLYYKTNFTHEFSEISFVRNTSKGVQFAANLPNVREEEKPISSAKYKDLINLLQWVPQEFHGFYKHLKHSADGSDFPDCD